MEFTEKPGGNILVTAAEEMDWKKGKNDNFPCDKAKKKLKGMEPPPKLAGWLIIVMYS